MAANDGTGGDGDVPADVGAREHDHARRQPAAGADADRGLGDPLLSDGKVDVVVAMVVVGDVHVGSGGDVVLDDDAQATVDRASPPDVAPIADGDDGRPVRGEALLRETGGKADMRSYEGGLAHRDPSLVDDCPGGKRETAAGAELSIPSAPLVVGRNGPDGRHPGPRSMDESGGEGAPSRRQGGGGTHPGNLPAGIRRRADAHGTSTRHRLRIRGRRFRP